MPTVFLLEDVRLWSAGLTTVHQRPLQINLTMALAGVLLRFFKFARTFIARTVNWHGDSACMSCPPRKHHSLPTLKPSLEPAEMKGLETFVIARKLAYDMVEAFREWCRNRFRVSDTVNDWDAFMSRELPMVASTLCRCQRCRLWISELRRVRDLLLETAPKALWKPSHAFCKG
ncbi:hypothetical protein BASA60_000720 [Batrachochytrium salamandrivorans]|nr:hypothetical protein BASA60_000720 [Batrachochytrium salamandrivorans]